MYVSGSALQWFYLEILALERLVRGDLAILEFWVLGGAGGAVGVKIYLETYGDP